MAGGGLVNVGTATLTNCTVSGNSAPSIGGLLNYSATLSLTNCTVSGNSGGGLFNYSGHAESDQLHRQRQFRLRLDEQ